MFLNNFNSVNKTDHKDNFLEGDPSDNLAFQCFYFGNKLRQSQLITIKKSNQIILNGESE